MKKTMTFAMLRFTVAFSVSRALAGDTVGGGLVALVEPMCNRVAYFFHERPGRISGAARPGLPAWPAER